MWRWYVRIWWSCVGNESFSCKQKDGALGHYASLYFLVIYLDLGAMSVGAQACSWLSAGATAYCAWRDHAMLGVNPGPLAC